jgi:hypothetical protein
MQRKLRCGVGAFPLILIALAPFLVYRVAFQRRLASHRAVWEQVSNASYDSVVLSNSLDRPTGGRNEISVRAGRLTAAYNPDCPACSLEDFASLTFEALFERIKRECLQQKVLPICNVSYDENFGYPGRIDTYTYYANRSYAPSITVQEVRIIE